MRRRSATEFGAPLPREFYDRPVLRVAREVLGRLLVFEGPAEHVVGRVVEVEAYRGARDPASHAYRGETPRNAVMFGPPGHAYIYFTYGMHHCLNLVTEPPGRPSAVLVRALEPVAGIPLMRRRRGDVPLERLMRGPGCITRALGLTRAHNGLDLVTGPLWLSDLPAPPEPFPIARSPRIGLRQGLEFRWRFFWSGHPCVSGGSFAPRAAEAPARQGGRSTVPG